MASVMEAPRLFSMSLVPLVSVMLGASLGFKLLKTKRKDLFGGNIHAVGISRRTLVVMVLGRMVLMPAMYFVLIYLIEDYLPNDQLLVLVLIFENVVPSANMSVIISTQVGQLDAAELLSLGMVHQYLLGIITLPLWCFAALSVVL
mmetsp:Transcript_8773/g.25061  ORF Transcript_8773/g.25061 Transcript_8773/m.25061 type:complete len:146 (+) Transcript_8773:1-438(+)